jgi:hypothetical protein
MRDLKRLCLVVVATLCTVNAGAPRAQEVTAATIQSRSYTTGRFALELDGAFAGFVEMVDGGNAFSDVVEEQLTSTLPYRKKHIANPGYRALKLQVGADMSQVLGDWIKMTFNGGFQRKNGAIVSLDLTYTERRRQEFFYGLITEVGFPALDATSKDAAKITVVIQPEYTRQAVPHAGKYAAQLCKQATALASNFRLMIDGVDTSRTRAIGPLTMKVVSAEESVGEIRDPNAQPAYLSFSNVLVELPESFAESMDKWFQSFVIQGNAQDDQEKGGTLELLSPSLSPLLTLTFTHLGIFELAPGSAAANDQIRTMVAKMYVETMTFGQTAACGGQ